MKKLLALSLALVLCMALAIPAFASFEFYLDDPEPKGNRVPIKKIWTSGDGSRVEESEYLAEFGYDGRAYHYTVKEEDSVTYKCFYKLVLDSDGKAIGEIRYTYDSEGNPVEDTKVDYVSVDKNGRLTKTKSYKKDSEGEGEFYLYNMYEYEYAGDSDAITTGRFTYYNSDGTVDAIYTDNYTYDANGNLTVSEFLWDIDGDGKTDEAEKHVYQYDANGRKVKDTCTYTSSSYPESNYVHKFAYDEKGRMIEASDGTDTYEITYTDTEYGYFAVIKNNSQPFEKIEYTLDEEGNMVKRIYYDWTEDEWVQGSTDEYILTDDPGTQPGNRITEKEDPEDRPEDRPERKPKDKNNTDTVVLDGKDNTPETNPDTGAPVMSLVSAMALLCGAGALLGKKK